MQAPLFMVPGNRDDNEEMRRAFADASFLPDSGPFLPYAIEDFDTRLVALHYLYALKVKRSQADDSGLTCLLRSPSTPSLRYPQRGSNPVVDLL